jgi:hypothetical protein
MTSSADNGPEGLWGACEDMEATAMQVLKTQLAPFEASARTCYESGVQASTLQGKRHGASDMMFAALFLKRALNDLRSTWVLLEIGYTSQAASVAASLFENALAVPCLAGNKSNAQKLANSTSGDLPWSPQQLARLLARQWQEEGHISKTKFDKEDYESAWREIYSGYKWLCKIKHPTLPSAVHDASSTLLASSQYAVLAAPDLRTEDLAVKATVLAIVINRVREAIRSFVFALNCDTTTPDYKRFVERMQEVAAGVKEAFKVLATQPLPFDIHDSSLAEDWAKSKSRSK